MTYEQRMKAAIEVYLNTAPANKNYSEIAFDYQVDRNHLQRRTMQVMLIRSLDR